MMKDAVQYRLFKLKQYKTTTGTVYEQYIKALATLYDLYLK